MEKNEKKRRISFPHVLVLLVVLVLVATLLTYVVPAGSYERIVDEENGYTVVVPDSYQQVEQQPVSFLKVPGLLYDSFKSAADIIAFVFLVSGAFAIIMATGAINNFCMTAARKTAGKEKLLVAALMLLFAIFGTTFGMATEGVAFIPMTMVLCAAIGYDRLTAVSIVTVGALMGYTAGVVNPFNVGIAQTLAELSMFSGLWYRLVIFVVLYCIAVFFTLRYAGRVKNAPESSILYGLPDNTPQSWTSTDIDAKLTSRQIIVMLIVFASFALLIWGTLSQGWWLTEMGGLFLTMGVVCGLIGGLSLNKVADHFVDGCKLVIGGCLMIAFARAIQMALEQGMIIDTIVYGVSSLIAKLPDVLQSTGIYIAQSLLNVILTSSNVQVVVTMPILIPVADLVEVSRQSTVLAFALGDGLSNMLLPTWGTLMSALAVAGVPYQKWVKYIWPTFLALFGTGIILMIISSLIGY